VLSQKDALLHIAVQIVKILRIKYVFLQLVVITFLFIAAFIPEDITAGVFVVLSYFVTFVVNFIILLYLFQSGFRREFTAILCVIIAISSIVGVLEGFFRAYIPFYLDTFLNYDFARTQYAIVRSEYRIFGTLGNPIIYGIEMALGVPFVMEVINKFARYTLLALMLLASFFTLSTTVVVLYVILFVGAFIISRVKLQVVYFALTLIVLSVFIALLFPEVVVQVIGSPQLSRALGGNASSIGVRQYLLNWSLERIWEGSNLGTLLFGHGLKSSIAAVTSLGMGSVDSLDNTYTTLLYETGILGVGAFILMGLHLCIDLVRRYKRSLHWYTLFGLLVVGFSFTTIYYSTFNLIWVASVVALYTDGHKRQSDREVKALHVAAHSVNHQ
jgi:hypothetical protein